jgi:PKD repeat protein
LVDIGIRPLTAVTLTKTAPATPVTGDEVGFEAQITPANATQPIIYTWDFGDGSLITTTTTSTISHTYTTVGNFTVVVTASHVGGSVSNSMPVDISGVGLTSVSFTYNPRTPWEGQVVNFTTDIGPSNATKPITYTWDFGDGSGQQIMTSSVGGDSIQHTFTQGTYTVIVTATNDYGQPVVYTDTIEIAAPAAGTGILYFPLIMANAGSTTPTPKYPDLVVQNIVATTNGGVQVTIKNQGDAPVTDEFWVDLYVNPNPVPTGVNQIWNDGRSTYGLVWGVTTSAFPALTPGNSLTLTIGDAYFWPSISNYPTSLTAGTPIYAQVDSANTNTTYGGVLEGHEVSGGAYNNISASQVTLDISGQALPTIEQVDPQTTPQAGDLPLR